MVQETAFTDRFRINVNPLTAMADRSQMQGLSVEAGAMGRAFSPER
jgi:hypothetical protein